MSKRVIITGASGLLGRAVLKEFQSDASWEALGLAFSRSSETLRRVDITDPTQLSAVLNEFKPSVIVHCAAKRRPDDVEKQEALTQKLNVEATQNLCQLAAQIGAAVVYISTDYVFDGKNAPYQHTAAPNPLNKYGASKLEGEKVTLGVSKENMVLRIPILYGQVEDLNESAVTCLFNAVMDTSKSCVMSDYERRFPTHSADLAVVLRQMADKKLQDPSLGGVFHWSGDENMTKYDMAVAMAEVFDLPKSHIQADKSPSGGALRPYDANLDCLRLITLGIGRITPFKEGIKEALLPYFKAN